jgi:hypothetical protein
MNKLSVIEEYWKPYLSQLQPHEYRITGENSFGETLMLHSSFLNAPYDLTLEQLQMLRYVDNALAKKNHYDENVIKDKIQDIESALTFVEKNSRRDYLLHNFLKTSLSKKFSDENIWKLIIDIWSENEFNCSTPHSRDSWSEIFSVRDRPASLIKKLPEKFDIFRGGIKEGFSWTRDIKVAKWFQSRTALFLDESLLMKATVHKDDVLFSRSGESEIVVSPDALISMWRFKNVEILDLKSKSLVAH